jgi:hypothetical protein
MTEDELKERLGRYQRVTESEDVKRTLDDLFEMFNLNGSVFNACNAPNASEYLFAREGMRTFVNKLGSLVTETEQAIEDLRNKPTGEYEYE